MPASGRIRLFPGYEMTEFEANEAGLLIPKEQSETPVPQKPVIDDWSYTKCDDRYFQRDDKTFQRDALERLYIIIAPGGGRILTDAAKQREREMLKLVDHLAIELLGGVPKDFEEFS